MKPNLQNGHATEARFKEVFFLKKTWSQSAGNKWLNVLFIKMME